MISISSLERIIHLSSDIDAIDMQLPNEMNDLLRFLTMIAGRKEVLLLVM